VGRRFGVKGKRKNSIHIQSLMEAVGGRGKVTDINSESRKSLPELPQNWFGIFNFATGSMNQDASSLSFRSEDPLTFFFEKSQFLRQPGTDHSENENSQRNHGSVNPENHFRLPVLK
jgi:hypothetical protein